jgi:hypothetical protein
VPAEKDGYTRIMVKISVPFRDQLVEWAKEFGVTEYVFRSIAFSYGARSLARLLAPETVIRDVLRDYMVKLVEGGDVSESDLISALQSFATTGLLPE